MQVQTPILEASGIAIHFGGVQALKDVSLRVQPGEILGIIGPNGAGKTTLFNIFSGFLRPTSGRLHYDGMDIAKLAPHERCRLGLLRTWQLPRLFASMTVRENVVIAAISDKGRICDTVAQVDAVLKALELDAHADELPNDLPPGQRKRLELARTLVRRPRLLMLDEVLSGQTVSETDELFDVLKQWVRQEGLTIVMIEHVIRAVRSLCDRVVVLSDGTVLSEGPPDEVISRPEVVRAYVGSSELDEKLGGVAT